MKESGLPPASERPTSQVTISEKVVLPLFNTSLSLFFCKKPQWVLVVVRGLSGMSWSCWEPLRSSLWGVGRALPIPEAATQPKALEPFCRTGADRRPLLTGEKALPGTQMPAMQLSYFFQANRNTNIEILTSKGKGQSGGPKAWQANKKTGGLHSGVL